MAVEVESSRRKAALGKKSLQFHFKNSGPEKHIQRLTVKDLMETILLPVLLNKKAHNVLALSGIDVDFRENEISSSFHTNTDFPSCIHWVRILPLLFQSQKLL